MALPLSFYIPWVGRRIAHRDLAARRTVESHNEGGRGKWAPAAAPRGREAGRPNIPLARPPTRSGEKREKVWWVP